MIHASVLSSRKKTISTAHMFLILRVIKQLPFVSLGKNATKVVSERSSEPLETLKWLRICGGGGEGGRGAGSRGSCTALTFFHLRTLAVTLISHDPAARKGQHEGGILLKSAGFLALTHETKKKS